jgi:hypothetical protein
VTDGDVYRMENHRPEFDAVTDKVKNPYVEE